MKKFIFALAGMLLFVPSAAMSELLVYSEGWYIFTGSGGSVYWMIEDTGWFVFDGSGNLIDMW